MSCLSCLGEGGGSAPAKTTSTAPSRTTESLTSCLSVFFSGQDLVPEPPVQVQEADEDWSRWRPPAQHAYPGSTPAWRQPPSGFGFPYDVRTHPELPGTDVSLLSPCHAQQPQSQRVLRRREPSHFGLGSPPAPALGLRGRGRPPGHAKSGRGRHEPPSSGCGGRPAPTSSRPHGCQSIRESSCHRPPPVPGMASTPPTPTSSSAVAAVEHEHAAGHQAATAHDSGRRRRTGNAIPAVFVVPNGRQQHELWSLNVIDMKKKQLEKRTFFRSLFTNQNLSRCC